MDRGTLVAVSAATLFVVVALSGCLGTGQNLPLPAALPVLDAVLANGATVTAEEDAILVRWVGPLRLDGGFRVTIPEGITRVETAYAVGTTGSAGVALYHHPSGRIRCQPDLYDSWLQPFVGTGRCSGLTAVDPLPATWRASPSSLAIGAVLEVRLFADALDGSAALLRTENLAMPRFAELPTEVVKLPATIDGEAIHVEVTRPDTPDPVPTILVSSPYNDATRAANQRPQNSTIANWVPRGYAVVSADVRGFGQSGGCVDVWGAKEQSDQVDLVAWVVAQPWSDGKVGFYGQSYVGTTPVEAASHAAEGLTTILTVAPVINAYEDWHFGGVPNGEGVGSPRSYQELGSDARPGESPLETAMLWGNGFCDPTMVARANDPRAVYDAFYEERDFKAMAKNVKASVFYTQGFLDTNVKGQMIPGWFNELDVPKKGLFGDWVHQHPPRADQELLFHAWFDHWLMGRDTGIMDTPVVEVRTNVDTVRATDRWPPADAGESRFGLNFSDRGLLAGADGAGVGQYTSTPMSKSHPSASAAGNAAPLPGPLLGLRSAPLAERLYLAGEPALSLRLSLQGASNTLVYARLLDVAPDGTSKLVTFGMRNAALSDDWRTYDSLGPGEQRVVRLPFLPTEYVVQPGHVLQLEVRSVDTTDWSGLFTTGGVANQQFPHSSAAGVSTGSVPMVGAAGASPPGIVTLHGGPDTALLLPLLAEPGDLPLGASAGPRLP